MQDKKLKLFTAFLVIAVLAIANNVSAHQPRIVEDNKVIEIQNPDISQAFYGELKGEPAIFKINLSQSQTIYFGILVPDLPNISKDISAEIISSTGKQAVLDGLNSQWTQFYEEFAGDNYWQGPDAKVNLAVGENIIKIYNTNNRGKYVLVVGEKELFPIKEMLKAGIVLPQLKVNFFEKPFWSIFEGKVGKFFLIAFVLIILIISLIVFLKIKGMSKKTISTIEKI